MEKVIYLIAILILSFNCQGQNFYPIVKDKDIIYNLPPRVDSIVKVYLEEYIKHDGIEILAKTMVYLRDVKLDDTTKEYLVNGYNLYLWSFHDTSVINYDKSDPFDAVRVQSNRVIQIPYNGTNYRIPIFLDNFDDVFIGQIFEYNTKIGWVTRAIDNKMHGGLSIDFDLANNIYRIDTW